MDGWSVGWMDELTDGQWDVPPDGRNKLRMNNLIRVMLIFLKCLILTCFLSWKFENVNLDRMVYGKREMANEKSAL